MPIKAFCWILLLLSGCALSPDIRVDTNLKASVYNEISSRYLPRPTFVKVRAVGEEYEDMAVTFETYADKDKLTTFAKSHVDEYLALIDKYLKWFDLAVSRKDQIYKVLGDADGNGGLFYRFSFYSGNAREHFLVIETCSLGVCMEEVEDKLILNRKNALTLRRLLVSWKKGDIKAPVDAVYQ